MADNEVRNMKKTGTGKSAIGLVLVGIGIVALIGLVIWFLTVPGVLESLLFIALAIVVIVAIIAGIICIIALPMYAYKGEQYQEGVDYSLSDVKPVKESSSEDDNDDE
ncbi:MAG: hypothetical protein IKP04_02790 [Candidatus Methanomethylophilaceae archaeon]|nr:hypothetical protein [Candidatus Methanomethylophilaceae archaeon]